MAHPSCQDVARALGLDVNRVGELARRGMPINSLKKARAWFDANGMFQRVRHTGGGAKFKHSAKTTAELVVYRKNKT